LGEDCGVVEGCDEGGEVVVGLDAELFGCGVCAGFLVDGVYDGGEFVEFGLEEVEYGSPVAISTQGVKWSAPTTQNFISGYDEMITRINPRFVVCYGKMDDELKNRHPDTLVKTYPTYWENLKKARKAGNQDKFFTGELEAHTEI
jgi:hypothetical protein